MGIPMGIPVEIPMEIVLWRFRRKFRWRSLWPMEIPDLHHDLHEASAPPHRWVTLLVDGCSTALLRGRDHLQCCNQCLRKGAAAGDGVTMRNRGRSLVQMTIMVSLVSFGWPLYLFKGLKVSLVAYFHVNIRYISLGKAACSAP